MKDGIRKRTGSWGRQIRSYIMSPHKIVIDHRTGIKVNDVQSVLDGDIDCFIRGYLSQKRYKPLGNHG